MKTLLIGASGQVGTELAIRASLGELIVTTRDGRSNSSQNKTRALDVADLDAVRRVIRDVAPDVVINATAYTAVDRAETERDLAFRVNVNAPGAMAEACADIGARFVHYSTDYVFDGRGARPYREDDATSPLGVYGESKLAGEEAVLATGADALILRTAWVYAMHGHNFLRTMLRLGAERDVLCVVDDQIGSPTPAWLVADATVHLLQEADRPRGLFNVVATGQTSRCDFASAIFDEAAAHGLLDKRPRVEPIPSSEFPTPARRPAYSVLDTGKLWRAGFEPPQWRDALKSTLQH